MKMLFFPGNKYLNSFECFPRIITSLWFVYDPITKTDGPKIPPLDGASGIILKRQG